MSRLKTSGSKTIRGFDLIRILGAAWADLREGRKAQGGSTITQQLARQTFLTREKRLWRKAREIALAMRIEGMYTKEEILELYLNKVYFGDGLYGAEAAARGYFGKSAADWTCPSRRCSPGWSTPLGQCADGEHVARDGAPRAGPEGDARPGHHHE